MELIYPMVTMVILTAIVGSITAVTRIRSAYSGEVDPRYFRVMGNYEIPEHVARPGRNFDNLFEVPTLFYAACLVNMALNFQSSFFSVLAWLFVCLRVGHSVIHLTYNNPMHRFFLFALSFFCVVAMWIQLVMLVSSSSG